MGRIKFNGTFSIMGNGVSGAWGEGNGAFVGNKTGSNNFFASDTGNSNISTGGYIFKASRSNSIYGNSTTVQPPAVVMNYIIKY